MLRTFRDDKITFVTQPDHAALAGYLAAHWGNAEFSSLADYGGVDRPAALKSEALFAIAQHDNGWWEWEADPQLSETDGLPVDLSVVLQQKEQAFARWRLGLARFEATHPYASLLISHHTLWLYKMGMDGATAPENIHPVFSGAARASLYGEDLDKARIYVRETEDFQQKMRTVIAALDDQRSWLNPSVVKPLSRMLQLFDAFSLVLCSAVVPRRDGSRTEGFGRDAADLCEVPRKGWDDRIAISLDPGKPGQVVCEPYPFDIDPLPVVVPVKRMAITRSTDAWLQMQATPLSFEQLQLVSKASA